MPVCSYVVFPLPGRARSLARTLNAIPGCRAEAAENRELVLLVTATDSAAEDRALRERVESEPDIEALVMAFGEIDPETEERDPVAAARGRDAHGGLGLPVIAGGGRRAAGDA